ncbi:condensin-2 complex subunit H2 [Iris pallida]|uniref:Condensin-2 complex subunit H2 n=1 Tax=Iris pallida TaxID=29817 RepID=A0AAX6GLW9_IRIPA|nr:condensin-2 complex subunit H2 [Iris pallida]
MPGWGNPFILYFLGQKGSFHAILLSSWKSRAVSGNTMMISLLFWGQTRKMHLNGIVKYSPFRSCNSSNSNCRQLFQ